MQPHPTGRPGLLRIPGPVLTGISIRFALLSDRDDFAPVSWPQHPLVQSPSFPGWWEFDLDTLALADGSYEYEFVVNGTPFPIRTLMSSPASADIVVSSPLRVVSRDRRTFCWDERIPLAFPCRRTTRS